VVLVLVGVRHLGNVRRVSVTYAATAAGMVGGRSAARCSICTAWRGRTLSHDGDLGDGSAVECGGEGGRSVVMPDFVTVTEPD